MATLDPFFDMWLQSSLQRLYDLALAEPVPEELMRMIFELQDDRRL